MKLKALGLAILLILLGSVSAGTLAYFNTETTAHNVITSGNVQIELDETMLDDTGEEVPFVDAEGVMPGQAVSKIVRVANTGVGDAWVRVKLETKVSLDDQTLTNTLPDGSAAVSYVINSDYWTPGEKGWYYYNEIVPVGKKTEPIIREVTFAPAMGNEYQNCTTEIDVRAQAVQAANNDPRVDGGTVLDVEGWPENEE